MMSVSLPLDKMTVQEKIMTMETLWRDLSQDEESYQSPLWHREILECRETEGGEFTDWNDAKEEIRNAVCK